MGAYTIREIKEANAYPEKCIRILKNAEKAHLEFISHKKGDYSQEPNIDLNTIQETIKEYNEVLRVVRLSLHEFSVSYYVPEFNMTLDELEMYYRDLSRRCNRLYELTKKDPCIRKNVNDRYIKHTCINYDIDEVKKDYKELSEEQDRVNSALNDIYENIEFETERIEISYEEEEESSFIDELDREYGDAPMALLEEYEESDIYDQVFDQE